MYEKESKAVIQQYKTSFCQRMTDKKQSPQKTLQIHKLKKLLGEYFAQLNQIIRRERHFHCWPYIIIILPFIS